MKSIDAFDKMQALVSATNRMDRFIELEDNLSNEPLGKSIGSLPVAVALSWLRQGGWWQVVWSAGGNTRHQTTRHQTTRAEQKINAAKLLRACGGCLGARRR